MTQLYRRQFPLDAAARMEEDVLTHLFLGSASSESGENENLYCCRANVIVTVHNRFKTQAALFQQQVGVL